MLFRLKDTQSTIVRPRVTPDPEAAAQLERRMSELTYHPENGFHRDRQQSRRGRLQWRLALQR
jgi:hypothetical protein